MPRAGSSKAGPGTRPTANSARIRSVAINKSLAATPLAPLHEVREKAVDLRNADHPEVTDDQLALVVMHLHTNATIAKISEQLGASRSWAYQQLHKPNVQALIGKVALAVLGVAAVRAVSTVSKLTTSRDEHMRLEAARELMDRAGLGHSSKAQPAQASGAPQAFSFTFGSKPEA